jgi:hypothetical protein
MRRSLEWLVQSQTMMGLRVRNVGEMAVGVVECQIAPFALLLHTQLQSVTVSAVLV